MTLKMIILYCIMKLGCNGGTNLIVNGDFQAYILTEQISGLLGFDQRYDYDSFIDPNWYKIIGPPTIQVRTCDEMSSQVLDCEGDATPDEVCQDIITSDSGKGIIKFDYLIDSNLLSGGLKVKFNSQIILEVTLTEYTIYHYEEEVAIEQGTYPLCFRGTNHTKIPSIWMPYSIGTLVDNVMFVFYPSERISFSVVQLTTSTLNLITNLTVSSGEETVLQNISWVVENGINATILGVSIVNGSAVYEIEYFSSGNLTLELFILDDVLVGVDNITRTFITDPVVFTPVLEHPPTTNSSTNSTNPNNTKSENNTSTNTTNNTNITEPEEVSQPIELLEEGLKIVTPYINLTFSMVSVITFTFLMFRFFAFYHLVVLYNYLKLSAPPAFYFSILNILAKDFISESQLSYFLKFFFSSKFNFKFSFALEEKIPSEKYVGKQWFLQHDMTSNFVNNSLQDIFLFVLTLLKIYIICKIGYCIFKKILKKPASQVEGFRWDVIFIELISLSPTLIIPPASILSPISTEAFLTFWDKLNFVGNIVVPMFLFLIPALLYIQKSKELRKIRRKKNEKEELLERVYQLQLKKQYNIQTINVQKYKEKKKVIYQMKLIDNLMYVIIPLLVSFSSNQIFFTVVTPLVFFRLYFLIKNRKKMKCLRFFVNFVEKIIWVVFHSINLYFYIHELYLQSFEEFKNLLIIFAYSAVFLVLLGCVFELLVTVGKMFYFIYILIKQCKKSNKIHDQKKLRDAKKLKTEADEEKKPQKMKVLIKEQKHDDLILEEEKKERKKADSQLESRSDCIQKVPTTNVKIPKIIIFSPQDYGVDTFADFQDYKRSRKRKAESSQSKKQNSEVNAKNSHRSPRKK